jgi:tetratricopeptide (TPR) repeat protein
VKLPRNARRGTRVSDVVQLVDILPTIAEVTHAMAPRTDGRSLLAEGAPPPAYAETHYPRIHLGWSELRSVIEWPHHLIDGPKPEVYDIASDPRETRDLREADRRTFARLRNTMAAAPQSPVAAATIDPEEARKLAALGYLSAQRPVAKSDLNPRDHLGDLVALEHITKLMAARRFDEAAKEIEEVLARNPGWSDLRDDLGVAYEAMGDLPRAEKAYRDAIRHTPELAREFALSLAGVLVEQRKLEDAEAHAKLAMETNPKGAHEILANVALVRGDLDVAWREAELAQADFVKAQVLLARNDVPGALQILQRMYRAKRRLPRGYWKITGDAFARIGRMDDARDAYQRDR